LAVPARSLRASPAPACRRAKKGSSSSSAADGRVSAGPRHLRRGRARLQGAHLPLAAASPPRDQAQSPFHCPQAALRSARAEAGNACAGLATASRGRALWAVDIPVASIARCARYRKPCTRCGPRRLRSVRTPRAGAQANQAGQAASWLDGSGTCPCSAGSAGSSGLAGCAAQQAALQAQVQDVSSWLVDRPALQPGHLVGQPEHFAGRQGTQRAQDLLYQADCTIDAIRKSGKWLRSNDPRAATSPQSARRAALSQGSSGLRSCQQSASPHPLPATHACALGQLPAPSAAMPVRSGCQALAPEARRCRGSGLGPGAYARTCV